jgi:hypothetical protein
LIRCRLALSVSLLHLRYVIFRSVTIEFGYHVYNGHIQYTYIHTFKGKFTLEHAYRGSRRISSTLSLTSALEGGEWSTPRPGRSIPGPVVQDAGCDKGAVRTGVENIATTGMRSPNRSARSESLNRLSYPDPPYTHTQNIIQSLCHVCDLWLGIRHNAYEGSVSVSKPSDVAASQTRFPSIT